MMSLKFALVEFLQAGLVLIACVIGVPLLMIILQSKGYDQKDIYILIGLHETKISTVVNEVGFRRNGFIKYIQADPSEIDSIRKSGVHAIPGSQFAKVCGQEI